MKCNFPPCQVKAVKDSPFRLCAEHMHILQFIEFALGHMQVQVQLTNNVTQGIPIKEALATAAIAAVQIRQAKAQIAPKLVDNTGKAVQ